MLRSEHDAAHEEDPTEAQRRCREIRFDSNAKSGAMIKAVADGDEQVADDEVFITAFEVIVHPVHREEQ